MQQLADQVGLDRFAVVGVSGGGPHALACAHKIPERLTAVALVSSPGPMDLPDMGDQFNRKNRLIFALARRAPWALRLLLALSVRSTPENPELILKHLEGELPPEDLLIVRQPGFLEMFIADSKEAFRGGTRGCAHDLRLLASSWGFEVTAISVPVHLWQGDGDDSFPLAMAEYLANTIPECHATIFKGEGHLLAFNHWEEILRTVA